MLTWLLLFEIIIQLQWFKHMFKFPRYSFTPHISQIFSSQKYFTGINSLNKKENPKRSINIMATDPLNTLALKQFN